MLSRFGIVIMKLLARLPLPWVRALGTLLGWALYVVVVGRRRVVQANLRLCFPQWSGDQRAALAPQIFVRFAQAWLDRGWLWHADAAVVRQRLTVTGSVQLLQGDTPTVIFAPHFVGMDAGWTALTQTFARRFTTIYTDQANKVLDRWIYTGRQRFGKVSLFGRADGVRDVVSAVRSGDPLYLLPDMNFGVEESVFVPFYGVSAATVPSLPRFAKLGRARVVPVVTRMTLSGYEVCVHEAWDGYPSADPVADTALMNLRLQSFIDQMPDQYYWVHKRFKSRPPGEAAVY